MDPRQYCVDQELRDGGKIRIRAMRPDDKSRLLDHFHSLTERSVYYRFFRPKKDLTDEELAYFTEVDFESHVGLVATIQDAGEERIVGVGRYIVLKRPNGPGVAEVAFAVCDAHQGRGIGSLLLQHLAKIARGAGVQRFEADVLAENQPMLDVFRHSGFRIRSSARAGVVRVSLDLADGE